ncbi:MAG: tRNA-dihydrouridine synthase family protein [Deltaproteobacteria bacterium]|nr:tRNA-dihydrouridine synthase family protein [Deltaproteobacteria bacterium]
MLSIGEIKDIEVIPAPLAGISDAPFRLILRECGAKVCFTEMMSAMGIVRATQKNLRLIGREIDSGPLVVQLFGKEPEMFEQAVPIVEREIKPVAFDINMGCPARKVVGSGSGAALMKNISLAKKIVRAVRSSTRLPVSIKIRSGWDKDSLNFLEFAKMAEDEGVDYIILHPRTRAMAFSGHSDWSHIEIVKKSVKIPVVGNGDVRSREDFFRMKRETGCDAVMIGRGLLGRPFMIKEIVDKDFAATMEYIRNIILRHIELAVLKNKYPEREIFKIRKHLIWYTKGLKNASAFRAELVAITDPDILINRIIEIFSKDSNYS